MADLEAPVTCALCKRREAEYACAACGRPICDPCSAAAPGWRFHCLECADPRGWYPDMVGGGGSAPSPPV